MATDARFSHRDIINQGADREFGGFPMVEMVVLDTINGTLKRATSDASEYHFEPWKSKWLSIADKATNIDVVFP